MGSNKTAYELERDRRVEENKRKMQVRGSSKGWVCAGSWRARVLLCALLHAVIAHTHTARGALQELGIAEAAAVLEDKKPAVKRQKREKKSAEEAEREAAERRVSSRDRKVVNYSEMIARGEREARAPVDYTERIQVRAWARPRVVLQQRGARRRVARPRACAAAFGFQQAGARRGGSCFKRVQRQRAG
jgi:hypothetical protein